MTVLFDVVDVKIPTLFVLDVLNDNNILVNNVINHLRSCIIINKEPHGYENIWKIKHIRGEDLLYVPLTTLIQLFYTKGQLRKLHK